MKNYSNPSVFFFLLKPTKKHARMGSDLGLISTPRDYQLNQSTTSFMLIRSHANILIKILKQNLIINAVSIKSQITSVIFSI